MLCQREGRCDYSVRTISTCPGKGLPTYVGPRGIWGQLFRWRFRGGRRAMERNICPIILAGGMKESCSSRVQLPRKCFICEMDSCTMLASLRKSQLQHISWRTITLIVVCPRSPRRAVRLWVIFIVQTILLALNEPTFPANLPGKPVPELFTGEMADAAAQVTVHLSSAREKKKLSKVPLRSTTDSGPVDTYRINF